MSYKVLVIGGSYFLGRIFCTLASRTGEFDLTLVNRGRYPMTHLPGLREYHCDRHDPLALSRLPESLDDLDLLPNLSTLILTEEAAKTAPELPDLYDRYTLILTGGDAQ